MFTLDQVVPWGRSFDEYRRMFALTDAELESKILGCADGPASFNAEATHLGTRVVSCDPLYQWDAPGIRDRVRATSHDVLDQTRRNAHEFIWDVIPSVEALGQLRMTAMERFLQDLEPGKGQGRYVAAALPSLPFSDGSFALALCSHFLFLYTDHLTGAFHLAALRDMCRVADEVRVFPLIALDGRISPYVAAAADALRTSGHDVSIVTVPYEFRRGGNQMLSVRACDREP